MIQLWSLPLDAVPRGLFLAREAERVLLWDENHWLCWTNALGRRQAQSRSCAGIRLATGSEEGHVFAVAREDGSLAWLATDLQPRWETIWPERITALAFDPLGSLLAVADERSNVTFLNRSQKQCCQLRCPRPARHLAFVPGSSFLVAAADFGWVATGDILRGEWLWRETPVTHLGSLAVVGSGEPIVLSCFSEGVRAYSRTGKPWTFQTALPACRNIQAAYDGSLFVLLDLQHTVSAYSASGLLRFRHLLDPAPMAMALSGRGDVLYTLTTSHLRALQVPGR